MKQTISAASVATLFLLTFHQGTCNKKEDCIDETKISEGPCTMEYNPVCSCNGKTYDNPCIAGRAGVTRYELGACK